MSQSPLLNRKKLDRFRDACYKLAEEMFGLDEEDSPRVQIFVIDRTRYWPMHYEPLRYDHHKLTIDEKDWKMRCLAINLSTAAREVDHHFTMAIHETAKKRKRRSRNREDS